MNHYDDEENIIRLLQSIPLKEVHLVNPTRPGKKFFFSLYRERNFENWTNNSGKNVPPPDFFSKKYEYMRKQALAKRDLEELQRNLETELKELCC